MPKKKSAKSLKVSKKAVKPAKAVKSAKAKDRRKSKADRRRGVIDAIYQRLVKRKILPDRRKGERRGIEFRRVKA